MHFHFALAIRFWGEERACIAFRKVLPGYSEHFSRKEKWRTGVQHISDIRDYRQLLKERLSEHEDVEAWMLFDTQDASVYEEVLNIRRGVDKATRQKDG